MGHIVTPRLAVDVVIQMTDRPGRPVILVQRRNPPHGWALPGGFVDVGERVEAAALREAREETGLGVELCVLLGCYSDPRRDPRGHTVSLVYVAEARGTPHAADDAAALSLVSPATPGRALAFDHATILEDFLRFLDTGQPAPLRHVRMS